MRFFKYLVLIFASIFSITAYAAEFWMAGGNTSAGYKTTGEMSSASQACSAFKSLANVTFDLTPNATNKYCVNSSGGMFATLTKTVKCPAKDTMSVFFFNKESTSVPQRRCIDGCTYEYAGGPVTNYPDSKMVVLWATGDATNCTNTDSDSPNNNTPPCDFKDPYGGCYVPPDDKCIRLKDGSITCPESNPPPKNNTCNGATYCKRPPEGCGEGYVSGSFNGEQLCVRSGPNKPSDPPKPDDPQDPNNCMNGGSYCPQPPDNESCPAGYTETTYNGSKICVKNNPDPEKPNPNDPNTDGGGGSSEPTDGGTGGGTIDVKGIIDAINALKTALLNAIAGISGKLDTLIAGQKTGNEHLKNIKDESVKTNEKLDKSNEHLGKIEDATSAASDTLGEINDAAHATSEAVGETNKKLDSIKDAIDSQSKCLDKNGKYRECTLDDFSAASIPDGKVDILEREIDTNFDGNIISVSDQCPPPMVIRFNLLEEHVITFSYDNFCYGASLARPWVIFVGMLTAFLIVTGQIRGGSDD